MRDADKTKRQLIEEITSLRQRLEDLRQTGAENLNAVIRKSDHGILVVDPKGRVLLSNPAAERLLGRQGEKLVGSPLGIPAIEDEKTEIEIVTSDGNIVPVELWYSKTTWGGEPAFWISLRDLTEIRRAELALRESEAKYRLLADTTLDCIWTMDTELIVTYVNPAVERLFGYTPEEYIGTPLSRHMDKAHLLNVLKIVEAELAKPPGASAVNLETDLLHKDGHPVPVEITGSLVHDESGQPLMFQGVTRDITERKKSFERAQRLAAIVESTQDGVISKALDGVITTWNAAAERIYGYSAEEAVGMNVSMLVAPDHPNELEDVLRRISKGETVAPYETVRLRKDGEMIQVLLTVSPVRDETGRVAGASSIARDITELKRAQEERKAMEEQFQQAQKMESVGRLAGGVAHDFNNLLNVIMGYGDLMLSKLHEDDPLHKFAREIVNAANRSAALTRQLLAFSRKQTLKPQVINLNNTIRNLEKMLKRLIGEDIQLSTILADDLARVEMDPGQLEQVIMNIAVNARDAMPDGGMLTIETANVALDEAYTETHAGVSPGEHVLLAMTDTGIGMDEETRKHLFEPFFTTKEKGKGTGLGMATVYGIVKQSNGNIWVYSEPGKGTTFKIYLPRTTAEETQAKAEPDIAVIKGSGETVLVVEDETSLRDLCSAFLKKLGYEVISASNGGEALLLVEEEGLRPDLVITDVVMPGMSGKVLADRLKKTLPHIKLLYMSGYTDNAIVHHGILDKGTPFIEKPFTLQQLAKAVRTLLDQG